MGYISKELILKAYKELSTLTEDHLQGQTQIVSAIRHFFAFDRFYKSEGGDCMLEDSKQKNKFIEYVNSIVNIQGNFYAVNFYTTIKPSNDCGVGSNFTSVGVVNNSKQDKTKLYEYPTRGKYPLFNVQNAILIRNVDFYKNIKHYLFTEKIRAAFTIWLLRKEQIVNLSFKQLKNHLLTFYSIELVDSFMPKEEILNDFIDGFELNEHVYNIENNDLLILFKENYNKNSNANIDQYRPYLHAIRTKPFLLLAGISGTGKSRIVRELAFKSCPKYLQDKDGTTPGNYCMIEVKPNWHDSTELLGYYSNLREKYLFTKFAKFLVKAKMYPNVPFFVCLDEMNLAPVEQYFAEILSILETRKTVTLEDGTRTIKTGVIIGAEHFKALGKVENTIPSYFRSITDRNIFMQLHGYISKVEKTSGTTDDDNKKETEEKENMIVPEANKAKELGINNSIGDRKDLTTQGLTLPDNVIIIGTVNMDDTTHQFSRKVIDRAMTIEMNGGKLRDMFGGSKRLTYLNEKEQQKWQYAFKQRYVSADEVLEAHTDKAEQIMEMLPEKLENINKALKGTPFEVSYRVLNELTIMVGVMLDDEQDADLEDIANRAIDRILLMKVLPRIEGDSDMFNLKNHQNVNGKVCRNRLEWLRELAPTFDTNENEEETTEHQQTAREKIEEMIERLDNQEFTRFWP